MIMDMIPGLFVRRRKPISLTISLGPSCLEGAQHNAMQDNVFAVI